MRNDLLYVIPAGSHTSEAIVAILDCHPEIKFVSLVGIDLAGNDTDEKIPVKIFKKDINDFFTGSAVQTDGSSVVLTGIASLNNAKVDMLADPTVNWFVDYNYEHIDIQTGKPVGTLRIPAFLEHDGVRVDSRSILAQSLQYVSKELLTLLKSGKKISGLEHVNGEDVKEIIFTSGTELEFWIKTPAEKAPVEELSATQAMQENYWARTRGDARTALEESLLMMANYGLEPEMGHKEVGGLKAQIDENGAVTHVVEQLEIDWRFANAMQAADNELQARILVKEVFRENGLEVSFKAKPIIGVAGNGEHTHVGFAAKMKNGKIVNLFAPNDMKADFMSAVGYGAIMGVLKNYEAINPFVSATNDSLNRLKPGFEAPVCIVTSLGHNPAVPSRNRTILAGLVRDVNNPLATRFEVRAPNPFTNTYIALSAFYLAMLDGVKAAVSAGKTTEELLAELSKDAGTPGFYLEKDRAYRSEHDVFEDYSAEERDRLFGKPPATVWENMKGIEKYPDKVAVITAGNAFRKPLVDAFVNGALLRWKTELATRIIPENLDMIREYQCLHNQTTGTDVDDEIWAKINALRVYLAKDSKAQKSLFCRLKLALAAGEYDAASDMQIEMSAKMEELKSMYSNYKKNMIDCCIE
jgi:glutamine synthetase